MAYLSLAVIVYYSSCEYKYFGCAVIGATVVLYLRLLSRGRD